MHGSLMFGWQKVKLSHETQPLDVSELLIRIYTLVLLTDPKRKYIMGYGNFPLILVFCKRKKTVPTADIFLDIC